MPQQGVFIIQANGAEVFRVLESNVTPSGLVRATVSCRPLEPEISPDSKYQACLEILRNIIDEVGEGHFYPPLNYQDLAWVIYRLAELLPIDLRLKQQLLECQTVDERAKLVLDLLKSLRPLNA